MIDCIGVENHWWNCLRFFLFEFLWMVRRESRQLIMLLVWVILIFSWPRDSLK